MSKCTAPASTLPEKPWALKDPRECCRRNRLVNLPHVKPLNQLATQLRQRHDGVPNFDPLDGGINARCLLLLEAPGPQATKSVFVSRDNPDRTAKNVFELSRDAGLKREDSVIWNVVPWYLGDGRRIRAARVSDMEAARPHFKEVLLLLKRLQVVVLLGRKAQVAANRLQGELSGVAVFCCPHPSPLALEGRDDRRQEVLAALKNASDVVAGRPVTARRPPDPRHPGICCSGGH